MTRINSLYWSQTSPMFFCIQNGTFAPELQVSMGPSPHLMFLHWKQRLLDQKYKYLWVSAIICGFVHAKSVISTRITSLHESQTSPVVLWMQNSVISTRITSLHGSHNSDLSIRIASLYGSQPSSVVLCIHDCDIMTRINSLYWSQTSPMFFCIQNGTFAPELQVSMGPSPHLMFLHWKQRLLDQKYKYLWVSAIICGFVHAKRVISPRITSLHESQTSPVVLWMQNSVISTRITSLHGSHNSDLSIRIASLYGSQPSFVVFAWKTASFGSEIQVSMGPSHHLWFCAFKTATLASESLVPMGPSPHLWLLHSKRRL